MKMDGRGAHLVMGDGAFEVAVGVGILIVICRW